jgi:hypothetical protein
MSSAPTETRRFDVVVHGATAGGVAAAVAAARHGATAALIDPVEHVGGMVSGGLTRSDVERQEQLIGGLARGFFTEAGRRSGGDHPWRFEPRVAEDVLRGWLDDAGVTHLPSWPSGAVEVDGERIVALVSDQGSRVEGAVFVDAGYEGDLLAGAGVTYDIGRDGRERHGEPLAGRAELLRNPHQFNVPVSAVGADGELLPRIHAYEHIGATGSGDGKLQSYCYRMVLTDDPDRRVDLAPPAGYDPADLVLLQRYLDALGDDATLRHFMGPGEIPNRKFDINSGGPVSTSLLGGSFGYPEADADERRRIAGRHRDWAQGVLFYLGNDERVPSVVRDRMRRFGLPADEFVEDGHWPPQLYIRDARRMQGEHVLTEHDLRSGGDGRTPDVIGMGGYNIDIREVQWVAAPIYRFPDVFPEAMTEGYVSVPVDPYGIPYRSLLPRRDECQNLLVSTCISASHVAFASFRMESQFMIAGQAAGTAAALAADVRNLVHDVDVPELQRRLRAEGQILEAPSHA